MSLVASKFAQIYDTETEDHQKQESAALPTHTSSKSLAVHCRLNAKVTVFMVLMIFYFAGA